MSIEQEIRDEINNIKQLKIDVGDINNHLNALEGLCRDRNQKAIDDAYKHGYDKGYEDKTNNDEVCKELASEIYQRGLNDAWEAARKVIHLPEGVVLDLFTDCYSSVCTVLQVFLKYEGSEVIEKLKAYEEKQKADDEIKVGDEVTDIQSGTNFLVTHLWESNHGDKGVSGFNNECSAFSATLDKVSKTGRHFDIEAILKEME